MTDNKEELLTVAVNAAVSAGDRIMEGYNDPAQDFGVELKADHSPLTRADRRSDAVIALAPKPTGISVLSEESAHAPYEERRLWERLWIADSLDGTKEFIKKNGDFTVNIALGEGGTPALGVIFVPEVDELYWGAGDGQPVVYNKPDLHNPWLHSAPPGKLNRLTERQ